MLKHARKKRFDWENSEEKFYAKTTGPAVKAKIAKVQKYHSFV